MPLNNAVKSKRIESVINIENAKIGYRNFSGVAGPYNEAGERSFCVFLEKDLADKLADDGWNVRCKPSKSDPEELTCYLEVKVEFRFTPPKIVLITGNEQQPLVESSVSVLDWSDIKNVDLVINPYNWQRDNASGVKAYLKTMYVTLSEDVFSEKYKSLGKSSRDAVITG